MISSVLLTAGLTAASYLLGTATHELTHWAAAKATETPVERVSLLPPAPEVCFRPATPGVDAVIKASTVVAAPVVLSLSLWTASALWPAPSAWTAVGFGVGYLPRSETDWAGVRALVTAAVPRS